MSFKVIGTVLIMIVFMLFLSAALFTRISPSVKSEIILQAEKNGD